MEGKKVLIRISDLDLQFLLRICEKVNVIPVIAKGDTLTPDEVSLFKKQV